MPANEEVMEQYAYDGSRGHRDEHPGDAQEFTADQDGEDHCEGMKAHPIANNLRRDDTALKLIG